MGLNLKKIVHTKWQLILITVGFFISLLILVKAIRVGVDPYHEGALFPSAVGLAEGLTVFQDVNNQYGFMYAIIQAPFIKIFGNYLLLQRVVGVFVFIINAYLAFRIMRTKLSLQVSLSAILLLCAINPSWSYLSGSSLGGYGIWINQYGITFTLLSVLILFKDIRKSENSNWLIFLSSFLGFCGSFVRLEFAAVWTLQLVFLSVGGLNKQKKLKDSAIWISGGFSALSLGVLFLWLTGGLSDAMAQLVQVWFSAPPNSAHLGLGNIVTLLSSCLLFIYLVVIVKVVLRLKFSFSWAFFAIIGSLAALRLTLPLLIDFEMFGKVVGPYLYTSVDGLFLNYSSILFLMIVLLIFYEVRTRNLGVNFESGFLLLTSLGLMAQLHNINAAYIFMLNPVFLACILIYFHQEKPQMLTSKFIKPVTTTLSILIALSLANGLFLSSKTTHGYQTPVLRGMASSDVEIRDEIDERFTLLKDFVSGRNLFMDCPYGLYSVSETGLITADKWTWNEIPEKWRVTSLDKATPGQFVLYCGGGETRAAQYAKWEDSGIIVLIGGLQDFELYQIERKIPSTFP